MPMPDFQTVMLPLLQLAADGQEHTMASTISALADTPLDFPPSGRDDRALLGVDESRALPPAGRRS